MRAYSTGVKAKGEDTVAGAILKELGAHNIADDNESLLEDLSLESVIEADPDYILVMTMGSEENATWQRTSKITPRGASSPP